MADTLILDRAIEVAESALAGSQEVIYEEVEDASEAMGEAIIAVVFFFAILFVGRRVLSGRPAPVKQQKKQKQKHVAQVGLCPELQTPTFNDADRAACAAESSCFAATLGSWIECSSRDHILQHLPAMLSSALENRVMDQATKEARALQLLEACIRACIERGFYAEALLAYDQVAASFPADFAGSVHVWSGLLFCAVAVAQHSRCAQLWINLRAQGLPWQSDCIDMMRYHAYRRDVTGISNLMAEMTCLCYALDAETRAFALSACLAKGDLPLADALVADGICEVAPDASIYMLLVRGHASQGYVDRAEELVETMKSKGMNVEDARVAMLVGLMEGSFVDEAARRYGEMRSAGMHLNVEQCTAYVLASVQAGEMVDAVRAMDDLATSTGASVDRVTQATVVRAYASRGSIAGAVRVLEKMTEQGVSTEDIVALLIGEGCEVLAEPRQLFNTFHWLSSKAREPRIQSFSTLIRMLLQHQAYSKALAMLEVAGTSLRLQPSVEDFEHVAVSCAGAALARDAVAAFAAMTRSHCRLSAEACKKAGTRVAKLCAERGQQAAAHKLRSVSALL